MLCRVKSWPLLNKAATICRLWGGWIQGEQVWGRWVNKLIGGCKMWGRWAIWWLNEEPERKQCVFLDLRDGITVSSEQNSPRSDDRLLGESSTREVCWNLPGEFRHSRGYLESGNAVSWSRYFLIKFASCNCRSLRVHSCHSQALHDITDSRSSCWFHSSTEE